MADRSAPADSQPEPGDGSSSAIGDQADFLADLAFLSFAASAICVTLAVAVCVARSGLGTPPTLVLTCVGLLITTAFSPFLLPKRFRPALSDMGFLCPLLMLTTAFSPLLLRYAPSRVEYLYPVSGAIGLLRGVPFLVRLTKRDVVVSGGLSVLMGAHLFSAWSYVFVPEALIARVAAPDPYFHSAIISMIRYRGIPSTGLDGVPRLNYHFGVHYLFASIGKLTGSASSMADMAGTSLFLLPCLCLAVFVATLSLRPSDRLDPRFIVGFTIVLLLLVDGVKNDRYSYRSNSELLGIIVLLVATPILVDVVQRPRRPRRWAGVRLAFLPILIIVASFSKISAGFLLAVAAAYVVGRRLGRTAIGLGFLGLMGVALLLSFRLFTSPSVDPMVLGAFGFVRYGDHVFALLAYSFTLVFPLAIGVPNFRETWSYRKGAGEGPRQSLPIRSFDEVVIVVTVAALVPTLVVSSFSSWYFLHEALWFSLAAVVARVSGDDLVRQWHSLTSGSTAPLVVGVALVAFGAPLLRSFSYRDIAEPIHAILAATRAEDAATGTQPLPLSMRRLFYDSFRSHHVLFGPDFTSALRRSYGSRLVRAVDDLAGDDRRSTAVFIPPSQRQFWDGGADCHTTSFFVPAVIGIPMLQGLPPLIERCNTLSFYGFGDYPDPASHSGTENPTEICRHARERDIDRVLVIRDTDHPAANSVLVCR